MKIEFTEKEIEGIKYLIKELNSFYEYDDEFENETESWDFEDVDAQRQIACELSEILITKIEG